ncbi:MAG: hypothetical protein LUQ64_03905 [Methanomicrobiales archaeon]|nr:hypothetical protein [Methanomicrobiales archaeon]
MKTCHALGALVLLLVLLAIPPAWAAAADVTVTATTLSPPVLFQGDTATLTVTLVNGGSDAVGIRRVVLLGIPQKVVPLNDPYQTVGELGAGTSRTFTFLLRADGPDTTYYPTFVVDFRDEGSLNLPIPVEVKSRDLSLSLQTRPETFSRERRELVVVRVGNPRTNTVNGVMLTMVGDGVEVIPSSYFIGDLAPDSISSVSLNVTPYRDTTLTFRLDYYNGANLHSATLALPITLDDDRKKADLVASNLVVQTVEGRYQLTGEVSNAGLEAANAVTVTVGGSATPVDPYRFYVIGSLEPDDFASFELSFTAPGPGEIPLIVEFKDTDGRTTTTEIPVRIDTTAGTGSGEGWNLSMVALVVAALAAVAGIIAYSWKKR